MQDNNEQPNFPEIPEIIQPQVMKQFCKYCGKEIQVGAAFCPSCGGAQNNLPQQAASQQMPMAYQPMQHVPPTNAYQQPQTANSQNSQTIINVQQAKSNGLGTAGFVFALLAFLVCWIPGVDLVVWFLGALFSFIGVFKRPRGLAIAGLIISFIGIIILVTVFGAIIGLGSMGKL